MTRTYERVITFGTFDLFHIGHLKILNRAKAQGKFLIVGISTDALNLSKKGHLPIYNEHDRMEIVRNIKSVDDVFLEHSLEEKSDYISQFDADVLIMGDDWEGKFDWCKTACDVLYLPRTPNISTTEIKQDVVHRDITAVLPNL